MSTCIALQSSSRKISIRYPSYIHHNISSHDMIRILCTTIITAAITSSAAGRTSFHSHPASFTHVLRPSSSTRSGIIHRPRHRHQHIILDSQPRWVCSKNTFMLASSSVDASSNHDARLKRLVLIGGGHAHVQGMHQAHYFLYQRPLSLISISLFTHTYRFTLRESH